jgi:hypothetical protein
MKEVKTTFSTCWYRLKAKFDATIYLNWIDNMLKNVNQYYLVIYCDSDSYPDLEKYNVGNSKIKIILFPLEKFHGYQYKEFWLQNHQKNLLLNQNTGWEVNMLWNEKIWFVENTIREKYFETDYYGWCDIGYFRGRPNDLPSSLYGLWPNNEKISLLDKTKIHYALINNDQVYLQSLHQLIQNVDEITGISKREIPPFQLSVAGGFFILAKEKMDWWKEEYKRKLESYICENRLVKDDQIILVDCIFSKFNLEEHFILYQEREPDFDNWFMFQRILK